MMTFYRLLLFLYPASWRADYGQEMLAVFAERRRNIQGIIALLALWLETIPDLLINALAVQADLLAQDMRYSLRALRRAPGFALTVILIAGAGIGSTTAAFTLVDHVLIRPFSYANQDRLIKLREDDLTGKGRAWDVAPANYRDWKNMSTSFESMGAFRALSVNLTGTAEPLNMDGASVTHEMLPEPGVRPLLGRVFSPQDDLEASPRTVILSFGLWQRRFAGNPEIIGQTIHLEDLPYTVIAVMPKNFYFPTREALLWTPMRFSLDDFADRTNTYIFSVGRLKSGVSVEQAQSEMRVIAGRLAHAYPKELTDIGIVAIPLRDDVSARTRLMLKALLGASLCVLLIACTNLANMLLARALTRRRELAVRAALGAGRERLIRQMLTESLIVSLPGGVLGLLIAYAALPLLVRLVPISLPIAEIPVIDGRVLLIAALVTFVTAFGFGILPALRSSRGSASDIQDGGRSGIGGRRERFRSALVITEVACSLVLLVSFGLLTRALWRVQSVNPGFRTDHVLTLRTSLPMPRYQHSEKREPFYRSVLAGARSLPGVTGAAYTSFLPVAFGGGIWPVGIEGHIDDVAHRGTVSLRFVTPGFFATMAIPLLSGRDIRLTDSAASPYVALVSQSLIRRYASGRDLLGRHINVGNQDRLVIGTVGDIRTRGLENPSEPQVYVSWLQPDGVSSWYAPKDLVVRTTADPSLLAAPLRQIIHRADPQQPITDLRTMTDVMDSDTASRRVQLAVLGAFGAIAILLAAIGIHGLLAFTVTSRTPELGVRLALGASRIDIINMTLLEALKLTGAGIVSGVFVCYEAGRLLQSMLVGVNPWDMGTVTVAIAVALLMTLAGSLPPALSASRIDPATVMRQ